METKRNKNNQQQGVVGTILTLVALGIMTVGILAGGKLVEIGGRLLPRAAPVVPQPLPDAGGGGDVGGSRSRGEGSGPAGATEVGGVTSDTGPAGATEVGGVTSDTGTICSGCMFGDYCLEGNADTFCGYGGASCTNCTLDYKRCQNNSCVDVHCYNGCWNSSTSTCVGGLSDTACGFGGVDCTNCIQSGKKCDTATATCVSSCPNGCMSGNHCVGGDTDGACGTGGEQCTVCGDAQVCENQVCVSHGRGSSGSAGATGAVGPVGECSTQHCFTFQDNTCSAQGCGSCERRTNHTWCDGNNDGTYSFCSAVCAQDNSCDASCTPSSCSGCKSGDSCLGGAADDACGTNGASCTNCAERGAICANHQCSCSGCMSGNSCVAGTADGACGTGGEQCTVCGDAQVCENQVCVSHGRGSSGSAGATGAVGPVVPICSGCLSGNTCFPGTSSDNCGADGASCNNCTLEGKQCRNGLCGEPCGNDYCTGYGHCCPAGNYCTWDSQCQWKSEFCTMGTCGITCSQPSECVYPTQPPPDTCSGSDGTCQFITNCRNAPQLDCSFWSRCCPNPTPTLAPPPKMTPTPTSIPFTEVTPTPGPSITPLPSSQPAKLKFKVKLPDADPSVTTVSPLQTRVWLSSGSQNIPFKVELAKDGDYFTTVTDISVDLTQPAKYIIYIKQEGALRRGFQGVTLTPGKTLDCAVQTSDDCGELVSARDTKPLLGGDADGFNTNSDSYNVVDIADYQKYVAERTGAATTKNTDFNLDGVVDTVDLGILARNFNKKGE